MALRFVRQAVQVRLGKLRARAAFGEDIDGGKPHLSDRITERGQKRFASQGIAGVEEAKGFDSALAELRTAVATQIRHCKNGVQAGGVESFEALRGCFAGDTLPNLPQNLLGPFRGL